MPCLRFIPLLTLVLMIGCGRMPDRRSLPKVIVLGVDGMDPVFVERHWDALPNLKALKDNGYFGRLATTAPPQSPVAWSTFITALDPDQHGIYDFVQRDPATLGLFSSMSKTEDPKFVLPLGPYLLPLSPARVSTLRHGIPFWRTLTEHGIPAIVQRMPINYPPEPAGEGISGMGTPDLLGTLGTFTFFTDDPMELTRSVSGGRFVQAKISNGRAMLNIEGPANPLRKDHAVTSAVITLDIDPTNAIARVKLGDQTVLIRQGQWSGWLTAEFAFIPHVTSVHGMVRIFAKQLHPTLEIYVSPINLDPDSPALPISTPAGFASEIEAGMGPYSTLGIPEDTSALRQEAINLAEFREQAQLVFAEESKLLDFSLHQFKGGFLFFYFSSIDQNSHILWGKYEDELLKVYREVDSCVGSVRRKFPEAELMIISDHGFTTFERAVNLNSWLNERGLLRAPSNRASDAGLEVVDWRTTQAYAAGLNGLYLNLKGRERFGEITRGAQAQAVLAKLREQLLAWRDPANGRAVVESVTATNPSQPNRDSAPDLIVGYAAGYRVSWQTALGQIPLGVLEDNNDAWIGDHCVNPATVPGVLFSNRRIEPKNPRLQDVTAAILKRFGLQPPPKYSGVPF